MKNPCLLKLLIFLLVSFFLLPIVVEGGEVRIENPLKATTFTELIEGIIKVLFWLALPIASLIIVLAAFVLLTSGGDPKKVATAKNMIIWTLVGLVIIFLAGAIIDLLRNMLGVKNTQI